jgi:uncharacterized protein YndB with AHSA1/START domain
MSTHRTTVNVQGDLEIVITRAFDAPRQLVFDAMSKPAMIMQWLHGTPGTRMTICEADFRVGGTYRNGWRTPDGYVFSMSGEFREIVPGERIVNTERFDQSPVPGESLNTLELVERDGITWMTHTMRLDSKGTRDQVLRSGMENGLEPSYTQLDTLLSTLI